MKETKGRAGREAWVEEEKRERWQMRGCRVSGSWLGCNTAEGITLGVREERKERAVPEQESLLGAENECATHALGVLRA